MTSVDHRTIRAADADVIVIGAGLNGLTCAAMLAQSRLRVLILEASSRPGGFCAAAEIIPGYRAPLYAHWNGPLDPALIKTLKLQKFGLDILQPRLGVVVLSPDGQNIVLDPHARRGTGALAHHSQLDAKTWGPFDAAMRKLAAGIGSAIFEPPLKAAAKGASAPKVKQDDGAKAALAGLAFRSIAGLAEEYFESPRLQAALALEALTGTGFGPRTPGGALAWIERLAAETQRSDIATWVQGGPAAVIQALTQAAQAAGASLRVNAQVTGLISASGRAEGVMLANGETLYAPLVVSSLSPEHMLAWPSVRRASPPGALDIGLQTSPPHGLAKVHLALRGLPQFKGLDAKDMRARLFIADSLDAVEQAFEAACAGVLPNPSPLEVMVPSAIDPGLAPKDGHVLSALVPFAPVSPGEGWRAASNALILQTIETLGRYAPDLPNRVLSAEAETPETMQRLAPAANALWRRPSPGPLHETNPYGCAVPGLYFCGAGTHPRLGASGLNGRNCAEAIMALEALTLDGAS